MAAADVDAEAVVDVEVEDAVAEREAPPAQIGIVRGSALVASHSMPHMALWPKRTSCQCAFAHSALQ